MKATGTLAALAAVLSVIPAFAQVAPERAAQIEVSKDGRTVAAPAASLTDGMVLSTRGSPLALTPAWQSTHRRQVGGLVVADFNGDGHQDVGVGCYQSSSYPPYNDWENLIYFNTGAGLEAEPSWISNDEVHTAEVFAADINLDGYVDLFSANGSFNASVIYFGGPAGPNRTPGWFSNMNAWTTGAAPIDFDHDGDLDVITSNQGMSPDPFRPMYAFFNNNGVLSSTPNWQSAESSIQSFVAIGDYDNDGWDDVAVSKWTNGFQTGIYRNVNGALQTVPIWSTGESATDKGVAWGDVDGNGYLDLAVGHSPTRLYSNTNGVLTLTWSAVGTNFGQQDMRFCDIDLDGDPDLAEVHFSTGRVHIYQNNNGVLTQTPAWVYDSPLVGTAIAFGDINGDRWPDLVAGFSGQNCVAVFYNLPPAPGDVDGSGNIDWNDLGWWTICMNGPDMPVGGCTPGQTILSDLQADDDVDLGDYASLQGLLPA